MVSQLKQVIKNAVGGDEKNEKKSLWKLIQSKYHNPDSVNKSLLAKYLLARLQKKDKIYGAVLKYTTVSENVEPSAKIMEN